MAPLTVIPNPSRTQQNGIRPTLPALATEIQEAVLLHLDCRTLLLAQRVNRLWSNLIKTSPAIQVKLFFLPTKDGEHGPELNPLLKDLFPPLFVLVQRPEYTPGAGVEDMLNLNWNQEPRRRSAVLRATASWRRMFPVQPPSRIETVLSDGLCCSGRNILERYRFKDAVERQQRNGASMGLLFDIFSCLLNDHPGPTTAFVQWHMFRRPMIRYISSEYYEIDEQDDSFELENKLVLYISSYKHCRFPINRKRDLDFLDNDFNSFFVDDIEYVSLTDDDDEEDIPYYGNFPVWEPQRCVLGYRFHGWEGYGSKRVKELIER